MLFLAAILPLATLSAPTSNAGAYFKATYSQTPVTGASFEASPSACSAPFPNTFSFRVQDATRSLCLNYESGIMRFETAGMSFNPSTLNHGQWGYMDGLEMLLTAAQQLQNTELVSFFQSAITEQLSKINGVVAPVQKLPTLVRKGSTNTASFKIYSNQPLEIVAEFQNTLGKDVYGTQRKAIDKGITTVTLDMVAPPMMGPFRLAFAVVLPGNDLFHYQDIGAYDVTVFRNEE